MQARYRRDYPGEFVITESRWSGGKKQENREWVENPINNHHLSGRAACLGSLQDISQFDPDILEQHRGGLLGSKKLQNYGTGHVAQYMRLDFAVDQDYNIIKTLVESGYTKTNIVYTTARNCLRNPGEFYLIPNNPHLCTEVLPIYLAAFDGHKEIYMLGYHNNTKAGRDTWIQEVASLIEAYSGTVFTMVGNEQNMPAEWMCYANTRNYTYREFISYCDV